MSDHDLMCAHAGPDCPEWQPMSGSTAAKIRKRRRGDGYRRSLLFLGVIITLSSLIGNAWLERQAFISQNNHHAQTQAQNQELQRKDNEILRVLHEHDQTLADIAKLQEEFVSTVLKAQSSLTAGQNALVASLSWIECTLSHGSAACGAAPTA